MHAGRYRNNHASPGAYPFEIAHGERTIVAQYLAAIDAAQRTIYIENQALAVEAIVGSLLHALQRGVTVAILVPAEPEHWFRASRQRSENKGLFEKFAALGDHNHFTLAAIAVPTAMSDRNNVYVHAKLMLVDDTWATIGSCNLHRNSVSGNTELNASIWDRDVVRALRCELFAEHLGHDTAGMDDYAAFRLFGDVATENRQKREAGSFDWQGLAFSLDPALYGA